MLLWMIGPLPAFQKSSPDSAKKPVLTEEEREILKHREMLENLDLLQNFEKFRFFDYFAGGPEPDKSKDSEKKETKQDGKKEK